MALVFLGALGLDGRKGLIENIHVLVPIKVKVLKFWLEVLVLILKFLVKLFSSLFDLFFVDIEGEQIDIDWCLHCLVDDICRF